MAKKDYSQISKEDLIEKVKEMEKAKKYGLAWEDKTENVVKQCQSELPVLTEVKDKEIITDKDKPTNILIEGDNYHALSVLNYTHAGKIDVIYIDPPYNTGSKDWKYNNNFVDINDTYRHSKWLNMMSHRLKNAKDLLKPDGVLICAIDENENARLALLLEKIFTDHEIHCVTIVHNPRGVQGTNFSYTHEYAYFVFRKKLKVIGKRKIKEGDVAWRGLRDNGGESLRTDARNCFYPMIIKNDNIIGFGDVVEDGIHPEKQTVKKDETFLVYPIDRNGIERKWRYARQSVEQIQHLLRAKKTNTGYEIEIGKDFGTVRTVWIDSRYDANEYGTKIVKKLVPTSNFDFPKSIYNTYDCIAPILYERKNGIVLDYFAGSGTTGHAVVMLNKEDEGNRKFILCTNNENGIAEDVCYPRIKEVIKGNENLPEITGISANLRYFKTDFVPKTNVSDDTKYSLVNRSTEMICLKEDTFEKVLDKDYIKIFQNKDQYTAILFHLEQFNEFKTELAKLDKPIHIYVFSLTNDTYDDDFVGLKQKYDLCPIPESILEVYRRIFKD